jgi:membrane-associated phospholipid phosphatase
MKAIFARQRPFTGDAEGKFFSGNWTNGSFPSGHAMFTWTVAATMAHEYHSPWLKLLLYGMATTVSTTRVTARQHFPSDVLVGSVFGYGIGTYVAHKDSKPHDMHSQNFLRRVPDAILDHVTIGGQ